MQSPLPSNPQDSHAPPRLIIERLTLENFKSYGGVVNVGPFHKSFSSIVGPNGSGKSNVIDAMLFVFGRRAKALRHNKLSELLHNSAAYPDVRSAAVTVYFREIIDTGEREAEYEVVERSEFEVCRRAFRNNTSKYFLNGKEVKMAEVVLLLKGKGVDLDNNRFLILQGEVEQIAMMKPKGVGAHEEGLLEYLEDIIGSKRHVEGIERSAKRVEDLNEERGHKMNRVKVAERERDGLEAAKVEAEDYLDKERIVVDKKLSLCRAQLFDKGGALKKNWENLEEKRVRYEEFRKELEEKNTELEELEKTFKETQRKADIAVRTMNKAKDEYAVFERRDIKLREDIKAFKARVKKLEGIKRTEERRETDNLEKAQGFLKEKEEAEERVAELENHLGELQTKFDAVRDEVRQTTEPIRQKLEEKQKELLPFSETVNSARKELEIHQSELKLVVEKLKAPAKNLTETQEALSKMEEESHHVHEKLDSSQQEEAELKRALAQLGEQVDAKRAALSNLSTSCSNLRRRVEEARAAKDDINTRSRLHNGILAASRNGVLKGVVGRLGDLASVDSKYATAVGAAAGANLDCIVVQTAENAQACIGFLRRENLGRATFVILEKIEYLHSAMDGWSKSGCSADGPRLFDFLHIPKDEHHTALYYALRDTLVADTLENARRMAFKPTRQNRVVSLSGELIESSGAMTGGGRGSSKYRLGSGNGGEAPLDPQAFRKLVESYESTKRQTEGAESQLRFLQQKTRESNLRLEEVQVLVGKAKLEADSLESRISYMRSKTLPALEQAVKNLEERVKRKTCNDTKRKAQLEETVRTSEEALNNARKACQRLETEIGALQEKIMAVGGSRLQNAKEELEKCREEVSKRQSESTKARSRAAAAEKAAEKAAEAAVTAAKEIEATQRGIDEAREQSEAMLDDAEKVLKKFQETEAVHKEWEEKVAEVQKEYSNVKSRQKTLRREELSLSEGLEDAQAIVTRDKHEVRSLEKQEKILIVKMKELSLAFVDTPMAAESEGVEEVEDADDANDADNKSQDNMEVDVRGRTDETEPEELREEFKKSSHDQKQLSMEIGVLESELSKLTPNLGAIAEYQTKDAEYKTQVDGLEALTKERDSARRECDTLRKARLDEFMGGFNVITLKLKELYQMITLGGDAELELVDSLDPFSEGIVFSVRPPKKSWKNISNLSGGEKTLSSLALVFALHHFKPTPLYFLDEIDAALDFKNVSIVANYVKERTKNAQFIIISLRNNMFELADRLVGIYKIYNTTKSVTVDPIAFVMPTLQSEEVTI